MASHTGLIAHVRNVSAGKGSGTFCAVQYPRSAGDSLKILYLLDDVEDVGSRGPGETEMTLIVAHMKYSKSPTDAGEKPNAGREEIREGSPADEEAEDDIRTRKSGRASVSGAADPAGFKKYSRRIQLVHRPAGAVSGDRVEDTVGRGQLNQRILQSCNQPHSLDILQKARQTVWDEIQKSMDLQARWCRGATIFERLPHLSDWVPVEQRKAILKEDFFAYAVHYHPMLGLNANRFRDSRRVKYTEIPMAGFEVADSCRVSSVDSVIEACGMLVSSSVDSFRHKDPLQKRLLQLQGAALRSSRELITTLPVRTEYEQFCRAHETLNTADPWEVERRTLAAQGRRMAAKSQEKTSRAEEKRRREIRQEYLERLSFSTALDKRQLTATIQVVNLEGLHCSSPENDSYLSLYLGDILWENQSALSHNYGKYADAGPEDADVHVHAAETLAHWFQQVFSFLKDDVGADFHSSNSAVHGLMNKLFWGLDPTDLVYGRIDGNDSGNQKPDLKIEDCSLLSKFLSAWFNPMLGPDLAYLFLLRGEAVLNSPPIAAEAVVDEAEQIREQKGKMQKQGLTHLSHHLEETEIQKTGRNVAEIRKKHEKLEAENHHHHHRHHSKIPHHHRGEFTSAAAWGRSPLMRGVPQTEREKIRDQIRRGKYVDVTAQSDCPWPGFLALLKGEWTPPGASASRASSTSSGSAAASMVGELVRLVQLPPLEQKPVHVVLRRPDMRLTPVEPWQPPQLPAHPAEMFELDGHGRARGVFGLLKLSTDKLVFERCLLSRKKRGAQQIFGFGDILSFRAVEKDQPMGTGFCFGRTLYVMKSDRSVVAFTMGEGHIRTWAAVIRDYRMDSVFPKHAIFGYLGGTAPSPVYRGVRVRHGSGTQKWFATIGSGERGLSFGIGRAGSSSRTMERFRYEGGWQWHRYHGHGKLAIAEYSAQDLTGAAVLQKSDKDKQDKQWKPALHYQELAATTSAKSTVPEIDALRFFRRRLVYEGNWQNGARHGKGSFVFLRGGIPHRFTGLFVNNEPLFGELERLEDTFNKNELQYYLGAALPMEVEVVDNFHSFHFVGCFELYCALACVCCGGVDKIDANAVPLTPSAVFAVCCQAFSQTREIAPSVTRLKQLLNEGPLHHGRAQGYQCDEFTEFDIWCLQELGPALFRLPSIAPCLIGTKDQGLC